MGSENYKAFKLGTKLSAYLPKEYEEQIRQEVISLNIKRERILAIVLSLFLTIIIGSILIIRNTAILDKYVSRDSIYIHFVLITFTLLFLIYTHNISRISKQQIFELDPVHKIMTFLVMALCAVIAINNDVLNQRPLAYIIAMYSIASTLLLNPNEGLTIYLASYMIYIIGILYFLGTSWRVLESIIFSLPLLILALLVSRINYSSFVNNFISRMQIEEKNQELDHMYKTVEEVLTLRTEQLNHAMEMDRLRTAFFSNISHELRTPLNIIFSAQQLLEMVCRDQNIQNRKQEILKYNTMVQQNCYRLIRLIENLIDITEIDAGQNKVNLEMHDIVRLVKGVTSTVATFIKKHDIKLKFYSDIQCRVIACDAHKIERIVLNLLSNAVKFTPAGGAIQVKLCEKYGKIIISVQDNGIGIPKDMKDTIFDRFVQVDQSTSRLREGSGIGLSIAKAFVEQHNGKIELTSIEGQGSEFIFSLATDLSAREEGKPWISTEYKCYEKIKMEFSDIYDNM
jgi:signal transduction histidine kinase